MSADLSPEQERALEALARVVDPSRYYLAGGVAVALRLHHRWSEDLDLLELECMKLPAIAGRGARRDFWDLDAMLQARGRSLGAALGAYRRKYPEEDVGHVVRSLVYFADAEAEPMPVGLTEVASARVRPDFTSWVRALAAS